MRDVSAGGSAGEHLTFMGVWATSTESSEIFNDVQYL